MCSKPASHSCETRVFLPKFCSATFVSSDTPLDVVSRVFDEFVASYGAKPPFIDVENDLMRKINQLSGSSEGYQSEATAPFIIEIAN